MNKLNKSSKIYIAGHLGMVGSSCWRILFNSGYKNLIGLSSDDLDLRNQRDVYNYIYNNKPDIIINAAAKVGGIIANDTYPYDFIMDNMKIQNNLIDSAHKSDVNNFIFIGSSCIYPKNSHQPIKEEYLLTDSLEPTNQWFAIAKISGVKTIDALRRQYNRNYLTLMSTNLYGPNDNFDLNNSHVLPAMLRKFHNAAKNKHADVNLWGSGTPMREFLYVDDLANAVLFAINNNLEDNIYNIGTGIDISISNLAKAIQEVTSHKGNIFWDSSKPDGTLRKLLDISKIKQLGYSHKYSLNDGLIKTYKWFLDNQNSIRR